MIFTYLISNPFSNIKKSWSVVIFLLLQSSIWFPLLDKIKLSIGNNIQVARGRPSSTTKWKDASLVINGTSQKLVLLGRMKPIFAFYCHFKIPRFIKRPLFLCLFFVILIFLKNDENEEEISQKKKGNF